MKKLILPLLFILALQSGGLQLLYTIQQYVIQEFMIAELNNPEAKFEIVRLSREEYEKGRVNAFEVLWRGKMYDVKSVKVKGKEVELLALHDEGEENVLNEIRKLVCRASDRKIPYPQLLNKLSSVTYERSDIYIGSPALVKVVQEPFMNYSEALISRPANVSFPPPKGV